MFVLTIVNRICNFVFCIAVHCKDTVPKIRNKFAEKELSGLNPKFHIHVSVSDLFIYSHKVCKLHILMQENMWSIVD
jgi:hypothetical protein